MPGLMVLLWVFLAILGCSTSQDGLATDIPADESGAAIVSIGNATYSVDLAISPEERQQGLSGREQMGLDAGMLFVFEGERPLAFWMKEMHFPLDIIWIDAQCRLIEVAKEVPPPLPGTSNDEIPRVQSPLPARYVLEVNAGEVTREGLKPGDIVEFQGAIAGQHGC